MSEEQGLIRKEVFRGSGEHGAPKPMTTGVLLGNFAAVWCFGGYTWLQSQTKKILMMTAMLKIRLDM